MAGRFKKAIHFVSWSFVNSPAPVFLRSMGTQPVSCLRVQRVPPNGFPAETHCYLLAISLLHYFYFPFFISPAPFAPAPRGCGLSALARVGGGNYRLPLPSHYASGGGTFPPVKMFCGCVFCLLVNHVSCLLQFVLQLRPFLLVLGYRSGGAFASFSRVCATACSGACFLPLNPLFASVSPSLWSGLPVAIRVERSAFKSRHLFLHSMGAHPVFCLLAACVRGNPVASLVGGCVPPSRSRSAMPPPLVRSGFALGHFVCRHVWELRVFQGGGRSAPLPPQSHFCHWGVLPPVLPCFLLLVALALLASLAALPASASAQSALRLGSARASSLRCAAGVVRSVAAAKICGCASCLLASVSCCASTALPVGLRHLCFARLGFYRFALL